MKIIFKIFTLHLSFLLLILCDFSIHCKASNNNEIRHQLDEGKKYLKKREFAASEMAFKMAFLNVKDSSNINEYIRILNTWGTTLSKIGKDEESFHKFAIAESYIKYISDTTLIIQTYINLGTTHYKLGNLKKVNYYDNRILSLINNANTKEKAYFFMNLGARQFMEKRDSAEYNLNKALEYSTKLDDDILKSYIYLNLANVYLFYPDYDKAIDTYNKALNFAKLTNDSSIIESHITRYYGAKLIAAETPPIDSITNFLQKLKSSNKYNEALILATSIQEYYAYKGKYKKALDYSQDIFEIQMAIKESQFSERTEYYQQSIQNIMTKTQIKLENSELALKTQKIKSKFLLWGVAALSLILILLYAFLNKKTRLNKTLKEKLELLKEKEEFKHQVHQKNKELLSQEIKLSESNNALNQTIKKLNSIEVPTSKKSNVREIVSELKLRNTSNLWNELNHRLDQTDPDFYKNITNKHPNLTSNELRICAFIRLNLNSREISEITKQSINSIDVAKSRIKKKLNLQGKSELTSYIITI